jgi:hypothetical protein
LCATQGSSDTTSSAERKINPAPYLVRAVSPKRSWEIPFSQEGLAIPRLLGDCLLIALVSRSLETELYPHLPMESDAD